MTKTIQDIKSKDSKKHYIDFKRGLNQRIQPDSFEVPFAKAWRLMLLNKGVPPDEI